MAKTGFRIDANYTEDVVGFALESYLTLLSFPRQRFSIEPFSRAKERWLGADARLHSTIRGFRPFYMQFKRPAAYPDFSASKITKDRKKLGLRTTPNSLYFPLRQKQAKHRHFQHNILYRLRHKLRHWAIGDAAYVCPLFLDRSAYRYSLHRSGLSRWVRFWRHSPWDIDDVLLNDSGSEILFDRLPILAEHVTIPPHTIVTTATHSYSFTEDCTDLCFHSPEALPEGLMNLSTFLSGIAEGFLGRGNKISRDQATSRLSELIENVDAPFQADFVRSTRDREDPIGEWFAWGDHLSANYGIEQYALVRWEDHAPDLVF